MARRGDDGAREPYHVKFQSEHRMWLDGPGQPRDGERDVGRVIGPGRLWAFVVQPVLWAPNRWLTGPPARGFARR